MYFSGKSARRLGGQRGNRGRSVAWRARRLYRPQNAHAQFGAKFGATSVALSSDVSELETCLHSLKEPNHGHAKVRLLEYRSKLQVGEKVSVHY